ncbi:MAG: hypothetical protein QOE48_4733, partial [Mycobacterium sp.]|nr:hypothetical protein [Mycobacterium sp.]
VVAVGVDVVAAEDVVVVFADDGDGGGGHQDQYGGVCVGAADAEVVQAAAVAEGEFCRIGRRHRGGCGSVRRRCWVGWLWAGPGRPALVWCLG